LYSKEEIAKYRKLWIFTWYYRKRLLNVRMLL